MPTAEEVRSILQQNVHDPEIMVNIVDLGLIYDVRMDDAAKIATIDMTLTSPGCPAGPQLIRDVKSSVKEKLPELSEVRVNVVWTPMWNPDMMSEAAKEDLGFF